MVGQVLVALSFLVLPAASVEKTIHLFDGKGEGCNANALDSTYIGTDLMTGNTSCKKVVTDSYESGNGTAFLTYAEANSSLKFQVLHNETCADDIDGHAVVMEASGDEAAKVILGECGEVSLYVGDDKSFQVKMYMKITDASEALALTTSTAAPSTTAPAAEQVEITGTGEHTIHVFDGEGEECAVLDTIYTGIDLTETSCKTVVSDSAQKGKRTAGLKCMANIEVQKTLKFKVHETCDDIDGMAVTMEASEAESAKILVGDCGEVTSYFGDDEGAKNFMVKMYMKITPAVMEKDVVVATIPPSTTSAASSSDAAPAPAPQTQTAVADRAESSNVVMPMVLLVLAMLLLAY
jgi:hypothetical protein